MPRERSDGRRGLRLRGAREVASSAASGRGSIEVRLGRTSRDGVAPSMFVWVERGVGLRPEVAREIRGRVTFRWTD